MNFNAINVTMFGVGIILLYSAIKDKSPKGVITDAFSQSSKSASKKPKTAQTTNGPGSTGSKSRSDFAQPYSPAPIYPSN